MKVAFIGLGRMGQAMARRLLDADHDLIIYNRSPDKLAQLASLGAKVAGSIAEAADHAGIVVTMLADDEALVHVAQAPGGLIESLPDGGIHIAMGTHQIDTIRSLTAAHLAAGQNLLAAPVLGRPAMVAAGRLGIIAAGPAELIARAQPLFDAIGARTFLGGGDPTLASLLKLTNNLMLACAIEAMGEAFSLVEKLGGNPDTMRDVLVEGLFSCPAYASYSQIIVDRNYDDVGFSASLGLKDINLALAAGRAAGVPLPSAELCRDRLSSAIAHGDADRDWSVMALEQARASGLA